MRFTAVTLEPHQANSIVNLFCLCVPATTQYCVVLCTLLLFVRTRSVNVQHTPDPQQHILKSQPTEPKKRFNCAHVQFAVCSCETFTSCKRSLGHLSILLLSKEHWKSSFVKNKTSCRLWQKKSEIARLHWKHYWHKLLRSFIRSLLSCRRNSFNQRIFFVWRHSYPSLWYRV